MSEFVKSNRDNEVPKKPRVDILGPVPEGLDYRAPTPEEELAMAKSMLANLEANYLDYDTAGLREWIVEAEGKLQKDNLLDRSES